MSSDSNSTIIVPRANGKGGMDSYIVRPAGAGPFPAVVVIHEIFGLNDNIREISNRFAAEGYAALAVDLFSNRNRAICMLQIMYGMLIKPLNNPMLADLRATVSFLQQQTSIDSSRIGAVGFCMGGTYALQLAITEKGMQAASVFYGMNPKPLDAVAQACPVVGSYPDKDFTTSAARDLEARLTKDGIPNDIKIYADTKHSFVSQQRSPSEVAATQDAWGRMLSFFHQHLKKEVV